MTSSQALPVNGRINMARALLIVMMVLVHITRWGDTYPHVKLGILSFMMPAFLFLTGFLLNVDKDGHTFLRYLRGIVVPYIVLVSGFAVLSYFLPARDGIDTLSITAVARKVLVTSIGPYWFLRNMFFCSVLWYAIHRWTPRCISTTDRLMIYAALLLLFTYALPYEMTTASAFYYYIGVVARTAFGRYDRIVVPSGWSIWPLALIVCFPAAWDWMLISVPVMTYLFLSFSAWLHDHIGEGRTTRILLYIGMNTLPVYLLHPVFTMASKYYAPLFGFDPTQFSFTVVTVAVAVGGSLSLAWAMDRCRMSWLLGRRRMLRPA